METVKFTELDIKPEILKAVANMGFEAMSPIQAKAIPVELSGKDVIGQAQTGTGKTAAFGIPILQKVDPKLKKPQAIVLCPTRELAIQVADEIRIYVIRKDSSNLWRTGDFQTDSFLKGWRTDYYWNTGTYDGPHEKKDCEV